MLLTVGDSGDAVKALQRGLNKLGSILLVDGGFGPATLVASVSPASATSPSVTVARVVLSGPF